MQIDTNTWTEPPRDSEQATHSSEPAEPAPVAAPRPSPPPEASFDTPATNETSPPAAQVPRERQRPVDPQVVALRSMFPDFDDTVLQYVLESARGDQERAIDSLLGMNDPNYVSTEQSHTPPVLSQTDLDEQLARRLMLEEEQEHQAIWQAQQQQQQSRRRESVPYEARVHQQPSGGPASGEKDTMAEIQEQFGKIAESGKKTFGSLLSKVKAKMQEFDQPKSPQGYSAGGTEPRWDGTSGGNSYQYQPSAQQYSFYDPNPPARPDAQHIQGYDTTTYHSTPPSTNTQPLSHAPPTLDPIARSVSPATGDTPRPPQTGGGSPPANIDPGKLGLLPKRPVSLLHTQSPSTGAAPRALAHDDDDDDLEYAENPFEEGRK